MENQNIKKSRGRPKTKTEDENLIALQNRQHNYYLNYKNKKKEYYRRYNSRTIS